LKVAADKSSPERLQKVLANAGLGSRREIESWIKAGRISVNGKTAELGIRVVTSDRVKVDKRTINISRSKTEKVRVLAYYKPEGEICTRKDPEGRKTAFSSLPKIKRGRWIAIGRLDINSCGLLLFTTDGELANKLMHQSASIEREYAVRVFGKVSQQQQSNLMDGVELEDGSARFTDVVSSGGKGANHWYHVVIMEGRNREVRRLWESQGLAVGRLIRVRYGSYILPKKKRPGQFWDLSKDEVDALKNQAN